MTPAAKEFIQHISDNQKEAMEASFGYNMPFLKDQYKKPMPYLGKDAKLGALQDQEKITAFLGFPGPMTPPARPPSFSEGTSRVYVADANSVHRSFG